MASAGGGTTNNSETRPSLPPAAASTAAISSDGSAQPQLLPPLFLCAAITVTKTSGHSRRGRPLFRFCLDFFVTRTLSPSPRDDRLLPLLCSHISLSLHESFKPNFHVLQHGKFCFSESAWGSSAVLVTLHFHDDFTGPASFEIYVDLNLKEKIFDFPLLFDHVPPNLLSKYVLSPLAVTATTPAHSLAAANRKTPRPPLSVTRPPHPARFLTPQDQQRPLKPKPLPIDPAPRHPGRFDSQDFLQPASLSIVIPPKFDPCTPEDVNERVGRLSGRLSTKRNYYEANADSEKAKKCATQGAALLHPASLPLYFSGSSPVSSSITKTAKKLQSLGPDNVLEVLRFLYAHTSAGAAGSYAIDNASSQLLIDIGALPASILVKLNDFISSLSKNCL